MKHDSNITDTNAAINFGRRSFTTLALGTLAGASLAPAASNAIAAQPDGYLASLRERPLTIGMLIYERMDQIDFTGPYSVLVRIPDARISIIGLTAAPVHDHKGLVLTPEIALQNAGRPDVLVVPGGPGQEALMDNKVLLDFIAAQMHEGRALLSVCTGALLCGAAGILRGRQATTHWSAVALLPYFGAMPIDDRVVIDGDLITAAGVTAGIDGALELAALLRGPQVAQEIQLDIQYAPEPPFNSGTPETAPPDVFQAVHARFQPLVAARTATAQRLAASVGQ